MLSCAERGFCRTASPASYPPVAVASGRTYPPDVHYSKKLDNISLKRKHIFFVSFSTLRYVLCADGMLPDAVYDSFPRLDALFADQAENIAQMASCLDLPRHRHREDPNAPAVTVRSRRGEWSRSPNDRVRDRGEAEAAGATASRASSERLGPGAEEILPVDERIDQERDGEPTTPKNEDDHKSAVSLSLSSTSSVGFKPERGVHENQEAGRGGGGEGKDTEGQSQEAAPKKDVRTEWEVRVEA